MVVWCRGVRDGAGVSIEDEGDRAMVVGGWRWSERGSPCNHYNDHDGADRPITGSSSSPTAGSSSSSSSSSSFSSPHHRSLDRRHHPAIFSLAFWRVPSPIACMAASASRLVFALTGIRRPASAAGMYMRHASGTLPYQESGRPDTRALDMPKKLGRSSASATDARTSARSRRLSQNEGCVSEKETGRSG